MGGLVTAMNIATSAALAQEGAMQISANNVANADTPGYTREVPQFEEEPAYFNGQYSVPGGVSLDGTESIRDSVLDLQIDQQTQVQGGLDAYVTAMSPAELLFSGSNDLGTAINQFFDDVTQLSANPSDSALRQTVLTDAGTMAQTFQTDAGDLSSMRQSLNDNVVQYTQQINELTSQIAALNPEVNQMQATGQDAGTYGDQQSELVQQLSQIANVQIANGDDGITITTASGTPLVVGNQAYALTTAKDPTTGMQQVYNQQTNITSDFTEGSLGGTLQARDQDIPTLESSLDTLAYNLATQLNTAQKSGYDLNGKAGTDLFVQPTQVAGAAANLKVQITDPSLLAAASAPPESQGGSSGTDPGGNGNVAALLAVSSNPVVDGQTPSQYYSNIVFQAGNMVSQATSEQTASQALLQQLQNQQSSISGVSLDEEATNLIQYQQAFEAAARVVNTVDECLQTALQIGSPAET